MAHKLGRRRLSLRSAQLGQAMLEFLIVAPVFILIIFGAIQTALIFSAKTSLNYAVFQAARVGAVNNATYSGIRSGLIRGLAPLYTYSNTRRGPDIAEDIDDGIAEAAFEVDAYTRIIRLNPMSADFRTGNTGHGISVDGMNQIPNDLLMYRDPDTRGRVNIQDANLLKIRVQYCYALIVPIVNKVIGSLSELNNLRQPANAYETPNDPRFADQNRGFANEAAAANASLATYTGLCSGRSLGEDRASKSTGFLIAAEATVRMQSPAFESDSEEDIGGYMCDGVRMACP